MTAFQDDFQAELYFQNIDRYVDNAVDLIRNVADGDLLNQEFLEFELIPALELNNENLWEQPPELSDYFGTGLHIYQYPNQLSKYLVWLARNAGNVKRYMEIGCRYGGTFVLVSEWLKRIGAPLEAVYAVDPIPPTPFVNRYREISNIPVTYLQVFSTDPAFIVQLNEARPDIVFIDGDHSMAGVMHDHLLVRKTADIIVHHDISSDACYDTTLFWKYITNAEDGFVARSFTDQYPSVNGSFLGIGVLSRLQQ